MRYSQYFLRTLREAPADETARNAELLIRGGYIHKEMAGVYTFLPLGLRTLNKIADIVREEMNAIGCSELIMSALCPKENWTTTGRWDEVDVLYRVPAAGGKEVALSPTHEEMITPLVQSYLQSPKDFPACVYQIQTKFRNEPRAKSGILRGREFLMKDAYSFHLTQECFDQFYDFHNLVMNFKQFMPLERTNSILIKIRAKPLTKRSSVRPISSQESMTW